MLVWRVILTELILLESWWPDRVPSDQLGLQTFDISLVRIDAYMEDISDHRCKQ